MGIQPQHHHQQQQEQKGQATPSELVAAAVAAACQLAAAALLLAGLVATAGGVRAARCLAVWEVGSMPQQGLQLLKPLQGQITTKMD